MFLTHQQIFDKVSRHLLTQLRPSMLPDRPSVCAYRGADNTMCAVGCLISDEAYVQALENQTPTQYNENRFKQNPLLPALRRSRVPTDTRTLRLLTHLQDVHDFHAGNENNGDHYDPDELRRTYVHNLRRVADTYWLDTAIVEA